MKVSLRALVVDDDPSWLELLSEILEEVGYHVDCAINLVQANDLLKKPYHLAIVDLSLDTYDHRNQDGLKVLEQIHRQYPDCATILLSGYATVEIAVSVIKDLGGYTCLRKEVFRRSEFRSLIAKLFEQITITEQLSATKFDSRRSKTEQSPISPNILVIEDDAGWRDLLEEILLDAGYSVRVCTGYGDAQGILRREHFSLVILDLNLAGNLPENPRLLKGEALEQLEGFRLLASARASGAQIIVISGLSSPNIIDKMFKRGKIFAYLEKHSFERRGFLQTVREALIMGGKSDDLSSLTEREREVLLLLAQGLTNREIAEALVISNNTVKRHLKSIFSKLNIHTRSAAVAKVAGLEK
ncbi:MULTISPECIES: response regulator transcription factor [Anaerolinea]|uniref:Two-component response regulator n=1 Tax=Anaerolinea thermophila (strain DSM 14523 / JCM 11388 / NBRC 100420 / UNI-1) TaxID=926569 RepID=E8N5D9_ANATU|nr:MULTISPECIES: DNA-binding response regulator [Anaerolinea]BAJ63653.1 putative two-component response regulator [Anaerolinea thermophila UNI-1]